MQEERLMAYKKRNTDDPTEVLETVRRRQKLLYLLKIFFDETDEAHGLTQQQLKERLYDKGISVDRKAMYYDIEAINNFARTNNLDFEIVINQGRGAEYYLQGRAFETGELKLLCDAVSSAKFIPEARAAELIDKISGMASGFDRTQLRRNVLVAGRKCIDAALGNTVLYNVDRINEAIIQKKKITFQYYSYDARKRRVKRGGLRTVSPYDLVWNDEQYYLRGYFEDAERPGIRNFRVDRIEELHMLDERAVPRPKGYSVSECVTQAFSMFNAQSVEVLMRFSDPKWMNAVVDRFGTNVRVTETDGTSFTIRTKLQPSAPFYGWLFQFGAEAEIISPHDVREEYERRVRELCEKIDGRKKSR